MDQTTLQLFNDKTSSSTTAAPASFATSRSSGSLESTASSSASAATSLSAPSLETSLSTSSTTSAASSTDPSPCPSILLRSDSSLTFPTRSAPGSSSSSPTVTFAPLPQVEARKRHPSQQLGVAARSRLLRHRRMLRERGLHPDDAPYQYPYGRGNGIAGGKGMVDCFGEDGPVEIREVDAGVDADEDAGARAQRARAPGESEDALVSLGRLVKGAGRTLWRSLSMRDMRSKERGEGGQAQARDDEALQVQGWEQSTRSGILQGRQSVAPKREADHLFSDQDLRPLAELEGGVWEEEIPEESWKNLLSSAKHSSERGHDRQAQTKTSVELAPSRTSIVVVGSATARVR